MKKTFTKNQAANPAGEGSDDESIENVADNGDELSDCHNVNITEEIVKSVLSKKTCAQYVTKEILVNIQISLYILLFGLVATDCTTKYNQFIGD